MFCPRCGKEAIVDAPFCSGCGTKLAGTETAQSRRLSTAAGILEIVGGCIDLVGAVFVLIGVVSAGVPPAFALIALVAAAVGGLAIVGGSCALRRRNWGVALAGAIAILWPVTLLGIAALVLTVLAREEFS